MNARAWSCLHCGAEFERSGPGSVVYCSDDCMAAHLLEAQETKA